MSGTEIFNTIISLGAIGLLVVTFVVFVNLILSRNKENLILDFVSTNAVFIVFGISLLGTISSLIYSLGIGFPPCDLCWYQRIFFYPVLFLSGLSLVKKDAVFVDSALLLVSLGLPISLFHNYIYYFNQSAFPCAATGASCSARYVFEFGFMTIPLMALSAFLGILSTLFVIKFHKKN